MASRMIQQHATHLRAERDRVQIQLEKARNEVASLEGELRGYLRALAIYEGQDAVVFQKSASQRAVATASAPNERRGREVVKDAVLRIVTLHADAGVKTSDVVDFAAADGISLDRNSVASLLSRLTRETVLIYDRDSRRYRPAPPRSGPTLRTVA